ncbi:transposase [Candidatus Pacearchaeota archaeon]|nr:transposase [Candidatus Pacearchaeota archaeon]
MTMTTTLPVLKKQENYLETERARFLKICSEFIDNAVLNMPQYEGRPRFNLNDIFKSLLILSLNGLSYRRVQSDLLLAKSLGVISSIPKRSTLSKYMNDKTLTKKLSKLIQISAMPFLNQENTLAIDSTWFGLKMYVGGYSNKPKSNPSAPSLTKTKKLHIGCLTNSKIIAYAIPTHGTQHDCPMFNEIVSNVCKNGFLIEKCLADAGYLSKDNYSLCQELGIKEVFIDFKSNITGKHPKSKAWSDAFHLYKNEEEIWHESYRYRVLVESVFSVMKKKLTNWLRTKTDTAKDNEMLLKSLCYNLTVIGRYSN